MTDEQTSNDELESEALDDDREFELPEEEDDDDDDYESNED